MIEEPVFVTAVEGDFAWVSTAGVNSGCSSCSVSGGCGISLLANFTARRSEKSFKVRNQAGAQTGDSALLGIDESTFIKGALLMYFLPLCCLIGFSLLAKWLWNPGSDIPIIISGSMGLFASLAWLKFSRPSSALNHLPVILRVMPAPTTPRQQSALN